MVEYEGGELTEEGKVEHIPAPIQGILEEYEIVFRKPTGLSPSGAGTTP